MTARREAMPCLNNAAAHWDAEADRVRYFANFEGTDEWVEISGDDFDRLTKLFAQQTIDVICDSVASTLDRVNSAMEEFMVFRRAMEAMMPKKAGPEDKEN